MAVPTDPARTGSPARTGKWALFAIVSLALFMSSVDSTIVATGIPTLRHALHTQVNWASWTLTVYQLGLVVVMPIAGRISDQFGPKRVFVVAAVLFTVASLCCGLADGIGVLIALRVLQAVGGAAFLPAASGMVAEAFGEDRGRALGLFSSVFPMGAMVGPILGGVILSDWSWRGIFLVNVPVGIVFTLLAVRYLPSTPARGGRADLLGAGLLGGAVLGLMVSISRLGDAGVHLLSLGVVASFAAALGCGWLFLWRAEHAAEPLIPMRLLRGRVFGTMTLVNVVWGACAVGFGSLVPLFAEERYGLSPLSSGTLLTARAIGEILVALVASLLIYRTGYRMPMVAGFLLLAGGLALIAVRPHVLGPYAWLAAAAAVTGVGTGLSAPAANNASIELAPDDVGAISGLRGASRQGGAIVAIAATTAFAARSSHEAVTLEHAFFLLAVLLTCMVPAVFLVPERASRHGAGPRPDPAATTPGPPARLTAV